MCFISDKCVCSWLGGQLLSVGCDFFFLSHLTKPDNVLPQFILTPPFISLGLPLNCSISRVLATWFLQDLMYT